MPNSEDIPLLVDQNASSRGERIPLATYSINWLTVDVQSEFKFPRSQGSPVSLNKCISRRYYLGEGDLVSTRTPNPSTDPIKPRQLLTM